MARDRYLQALRGLAIAAVVLIHCLPQCPATVALRPFLNFSVALFLSLSGFLTDEDKIRGVLQRRVRKVAVRMRFGISFTSSCFRIIHWHLGLSRS